MRHSVLKIAVAIAGLAAASVPALGQDAYFRLTNNSLGSGRSLEALQVPNTSAPVGIMLPTSNDPGQYWQFQRAGRFLQLTNALNGPRMCLEVNPTGGALFMNPCGPQTGQRWQLDETQRPTVRLRNAAWPGKCLDVVRAEDYYFPVMGDCQASLDSLNWSMPSAGRR